MVIEIADIAVKPGAEEEFAAAFKGVRDLLAGFAGCRSVRLTRGVESPSRFVLLVEWDSVEAHQQFLAEHGAAFGAAIGSYFAAAPAVEHVSEVD